VAGPSGLGLPRAMAALVAAAALLPAIGGCAGDDDGATATGDMADAGLGGTLTWSIGSRPAQIDPLRATSRAEQLVTRQVHEPLVASLVGPFGDVRRVPGLALAVRASSDRTIWRLRLREGVRFQDGTPFNGGAVVVNSERWRTTVEGRRLAPALFAEDAPRQDLVRFFLDQPDPDFDRVLASPRLGVVSPKALPPPGNGDARLRRTDRSGTGPFELRERDSQHALVARNLGWWGSERDLGPALDQVDFRVEPGSSERLSMLRAGAVQLADELAPEQRRRLRRDPLLTALPGPGGTVLGLERSVRGIESGRSVPSLSGAWLTRIGAG
jgi:ABC-type transport system substrate-binding protein